MTHTSPTLARVAAIKTFVRDFVVTCACTPAAIEMRAEAGGLECARHGRPIVRRARAVEEHAADGVTE